MRHCIFLKAEAKPPRISNSFKFSVSSSMRLVTQQWLRTISTFVKFGNRLFPEGLEKHVDAWSEPFWHLSFLIVLSFLRWVFFFFVVNVSHRQSIHLRSSDFYIIYLLTLDNLYLYYKVMCKYISSVRLLTFFHIQFNCDLLISNNDQWLY